MLAVLLFVCVYVFCFFFCFFLFFGYCCCCWFFHNLSIGKKVICKVERLNVKQRRS